MLNWKLILYSIISLSVLSGREFESPRPDRCCLSASPVLLFQFSATRTD